MAGEMILAGQDLREETIRNIAEEDPTRPNHQDQVDVVVQDLPLAVDPKIMESLNDWINDLGWLNN